MQVRSFFRPYWKGSKWRPKQKLQTNRQNSDKAGGQETKSRISEYWCTRHTSTSNHSICALWTSRRHSTRSQMISSGWLWWTWDILCTWFDLLAKLYRKQLTKVKVVGTLSEWFRVKKRVRQGCVISLYLFNVLAEIVMGENSMDFKVDCKSEGR